MRLKCKEVFHISTVSTGCTCIYCKERSEDLNLYKWLNIIIGELNESNLIRIRFSFNICNHCLDRMNSIVYIDENKCIKCKNKNIYTYSFASLYHDKISQKYPGILAGVAIGDGYNEYKLVPHWNYNQIADRKLIIEAEEYIKTLDVTDNILFCNKCYDELIYNIKIAKVKNILL